MSEDMSAEEIEYREQQEVIEDDNQSSDKNKGRKEIEKFCGMLKDIRGGNVEVFSAGGKGTIYHSYRSPKFFIYGGDEDKIKNTALTIEGDYLENPDNVEKVLKEYEIPGKPFFIYKMALEAVRFEPSVYHKFEKELKNDEEIKKLYESLRSPEQERIDIENEVKKKDKKEKVAEEDKEVAYNKEVLDEKNSSLSSILSQIEKVEKNIASDIDEEQRTELEEVKKAAQGVLEKMPEYEKKVVAGQLKGDDFEEYISVVDDRITLANQYWDESIKPLYKQKFAKKINASLADINTEIKEVKSISNAHFLDETFINEFSEFVKQFEPNISDHKEPQKRLKEITSTLNTAQLKKYTVLFLQNMSQKENKVFSENEIAHSNLFKQLNTLLVSLKINHNIPSQLEEKDFKKLEASSRLEELKEEYQSLKQVKTNIDTELLSKVENELKDIDSLQKELSMLRNSKVKYEEELKALLSEVFNKEGRFTIINSELKTKYNIDLSHVADSSIKEKKLSQEEIEKVDKAFEGMEKNITQNSVEQKTFSNAFNEKFYHFMLTRFPNMKSIIGKDKELPQENGNIIFNDEALIIMTKYIDAKNLEMLVTAFLEDELIRRTQLKNPLDYDVVKENPIFSDLKHSLLHAKYNKEVKSELSDEEKKDVDAKHQNQIDAREEIYSKYLDHISLEDLSDVKEEILYSKKFSYSKNNVDTVKKHIAYQALLKTINRKNELLTKEEQEEIEKKYDIPFKTLKRDLIINAANGGVEENKPPKDTDPDFKTMQTLQQFNDNGLISKKLSFISSEFFLLKDAVNQLMIAGVKQECLSTILDSKQDWIKDCGMPKERVAKVIKILQDTRLDKYKNLPFMKSLQKEYGFSEEEMNAYVKGGDVMAEEQIKMSEKLQEYRDKENKAMKEKLEEIRKKIKEAQKKADEIAKKKAKVEERYAKAKKNIIGNDMLSSNYLQSQMDFAQDKMTRLKRLGASVGDNMLSLGYRTMVLPSMNLMSSIGKSLKEDISKSLQGEQAQADFTVLKEITKFPFVGVMDFTHKKVSDVLMDPKYKDHWALKHLYAKEPVNPLRAMLNKQMHADTRKFIHSKQQNDKMEEVVDQEKKKRLPDLVSDYFDDAKVKLQTSTKGLAYYHENLKDFTDPKRIKHYESLIDDNFIEADEQKKLKDKLKEVQKIAAIEAFKDALNPYTRAQNYDKKFITFLKQKAAKMSSEDIREVANDLPVEVLLENGIDNNEVTKDMLINLLDGRTKEVNKQLNYVQQFEDKEAKLYSKYVNDPDLSIPYDRKIAEHIGANTAMVKVLLVDSEGNETYETLPLENVQPNGKRETLFSLSGKETENVEKSLEESDGRYQTNQGFLTQSDLEKITYFKEGKKISLKKGASYQLEGKTYTIQGVETHGSLGVMSDAEAKVYGKGAQEGMLVNTNDVNGDMLQNLQALSSEEEGAFRQNARKNAYSIKTEGITQVEAAMMVENHPPYKLESYDNLSHNEQILRNLYRYNRTEDEGKKAKLAEEIKKLGGKEIKYYESILTIDSAKLSEGSYLKQNFDEIQDYVVTKKSLRDLMVIKNDEEFQEKLSEEMKTGSIDKTIKIYIEDERKKELKEQKEAKESDEKQESGYLAKATKLAKNVVFKKDQDSSQKVSLNSREDVEEEIEEGIKKGLKKTGKVAKSIVNKVSPIPIP